MKTEISEANSSAWLALMISTAGFRVNVAVFDGAFFDALKGKSAPNSKVRAKTMWGWIAWSLHGESGYERLKPHDEAQIAPGGDEILALLEAGPNLILLDEVLQYLISAGGIKIEQTTLRDETLTFLQRLTTTVANTKDTALVFTLQSSKRESLDYVNLLQTVDHLAARKDQRREPVEGAEIPRVIQRRLLAKVPTPTDAAPAAQAYQDIVTQMRRAYAQTSAEAAGRGRRDRAARSHSFRLSVPSVAGRPHAGAVGGDSGFPAHPRRLALPRRLSPGRAQSRQEPRAARPGRRSNSGRRSPPGVLQGGRTAERLPGRPRT
jgi:Protein of unknown function (DUF499)